MLWVVHAMFYFGVKSNMSKGHVTDRGYQPIACEWLTLLEVGWLKRKGLSMLKVSSHFLKELYMHL